MSASTTAQTNSHTTPRQNQLQTLVDRCPDFPPDTTVEPADHYPADYLVDVTMVEPRVTAMLRNVGVQIAGVRPRTTETGDAFVTLYLECSDGPSPPQTPPSPAEPTSLTDHSDSHAHNNPSQSPTPATQPESESESESDSDPAPDPAPTTFDTVSASPFPVTIHTVGGREPDGSPTYIGPWTFQTKMIRDRVEGNLTGRVLNACAGKTKLHHTDEIIRNDLNPNRDADYHIDIANIDTEFDPASFGTVVLDPPFDQSQADEHYESMHARQLGPARRKLAALVAPGGVFIELGWNFHSPAAFDGWEREALHIFHRGPTLHPVFMTIDRRTTRQTSFTEFRD